MPLNFLAKLACIFLLLFNVSAWPTLSSEQLSIIIKNNRLVVGIKADFPPFGYYDKSGNIVGMEADLSRDIADRLGVELVLLPVSSSNRINRLNQGQIDILIATMAYTKQRQKQTGMLMPHYYASGINLVVSSNASFKPSSWDDLHWESICLHSSSYFNAEMIERFLFRPLILDSIRDIAIALKLEKCVGWLYDNAAIASLLQQENWYNFVTPLPPIDLTPWSISVHPSEQKSEFGQFISNIIGEWHRNGTLLALEKKWHLPRTQFLVEANIQWNKKTEEGVFLCAQNNQGHYPNECHNKYQKDDDGFFSTVKYKIRKLIHKSWLTWRNKAR